MWNFFLTETEREKVKTVSRARGWLINTSSLHLLSAFSSLQLFSRLRQRIHVCLYNLLYWIFLVSFKQNHFDGSEVPRFSDSGVSERFKQFTLLHKFEHPESRCLFIQLHIKISFLIPHMRHTIIMTWSKKNPRNWMMKIKQMRNRKAIKVYLRELIYQQFIHPSHSDVLKSFRESENLLIWIHSGAEFMDEWEWKSCEKLILRNGENQLKIFCLESRKKEKQKIFTTSKTFYANSFPKGIKFFSNFHEMQT